jgi:hypothetical protein
VALAAVKPVARRAILSLILFGIAFGQVEAAVVVYLRTIAAPIRASLGLPAGEPMPLFGPSHLGPLQHLVYIELAREAATLIMLAAVAYAVSKNLPTWLAAFSVAFGAWDLMFYFWLKVMIGWPSSLGTWDVLFLLPVPWAAPVAAPSIVALSLVIGGCFAFFRPPDRVPRTAWTCLLVGAVVLLVSFMWDWPLWVQGGAPRGFPWAVFGLGELLGIAGFVLGVRPITRQPDQLAEFDGLRGTQQAGE